ncbi:hypothetical protein INS49_011807 [Diaporthe citri]|uniref:uncharacterized protein n=1 Tax=Diaporthe citri TaxID=83186 RepID=UPI001C7EAAB6|nr:uncharacterized protein INS49_011807 [Diaporthe citri]KAG6360741.1 hypothetical protein INS49_011807 [Diaporthe citri]
MAESSTSMDNTGKSPPLKRRKVRSGTQSCWECKRRKTRCTFAAPNESVCDGCRSRGVKCIGQDFDDGAVEKGDKAGGRSRAETVAERLSMLDASDLSNPKIQDGEGATGKKASSPADARTDTPQVNKRHNDLCRALLEVWPEQEDLDVILDAPIDHVPPGGDCMQIVTSDDELVSSLEGIECIMIEAMYHNNAGNLRHGWVTHRRAMTIAQMLGLHRGTAASATLLDVRNRGRTDPEHMWCRLIISDRYLSLMLGLPQASLENPFESPQALESCTPMERTERMESIVGGLILQRNGADLHNLVKTQEADKLLQEAAASMPPQWWVAPCVAAAAGHESEELYETTIRLMNQFTHYHLLVQLHLPYLLQPSDERKYDYSKATAVMASREILTRFVSFRGSVSVAAYCRGVDLLAFIASTVLTLVHIDARRQQRVSGSECGNALHMVAHQRLSDRGLLEQTLQCILKMAESEEDAMAYKIPIILKQLLAIEDNAAKDDSYSTTISSEPGVPESQYGDKPESEAREQRDSDFSQIGLDTATLLVPGLTADVDDWALQGVDMALFDNLIRGAAEPSADPA